MIINFKCCRTERLFRSGKTRAWSDIINVVERKLTMLDAASVLSDLLSPPGNRLEALGGNRKGQHSIRINAQWRICFIWGANGPEAVEIVDYH
ncbi:MULTISPECIES: type II toxin-antitoxin system RelE/ParE family toxin [Pseudomonas]|jgi:proteic killer suppression protein|uniref:Proteic killer suppression protein n=1 Tax=Pseudomonas psychrophila TaxID=122355 RepID=A0ABY0VGX6_9PSED|nr:MULTISPECIES: type II toxin-antitoxin system RelE/ParE family toxin [Pseudomonas]KAB0484615.1 proteic killer protein [Pseudomonas psychrophila]KMM96652.1 proteic killer protein [Pseudomonas psychrophila]MDY7583062.1 type II toxin-antitoxin system RelE/ParE family toxin [Pseudomonas sp. CCI3.1]MEB0066413.1 type II toxin-antitoxin system RelE/ParE family toxin [Pseudomonas sp. CCI3.1]MEB0071343.1 type II toxin-antitoxin system RelE/ParE family toxin [Pseudomonas sp. CCI1.4]